MPKIELIQGDCLEKMKDIPDGGIDLILTDPPYGTTACKWDYVIPFEPMWAQLKRVIKPNGAIVLFGSEPFSSALRMSNIKMYKYDWVWEKTTATGYLDAKKKPLKYHEIISVFYEKQPTYNPIKTFGHTRKVSSKKHKEKTTLNQAEQYKKADNFTDYDSTERYPKSIQTFMVDKYKERFHPTQKPVALMEYLIKTYTNEGETVLDFTMGSGTTIVAAKKLGRNAIGIELDPEYFMTAEKRINENL